MLRVLKMDLILSRNIFLINASIFVPLLLFMASWAEALPPMLFAGFSSLMVAFVPASLVTREDKFKAMTLVCSLPVTRRKIVQARYVLSVGVVFVGVPSVFALCGFMPFTRFSPIDLFSIDPLILGFSSACFVTSLLLPFVLRFGARGLILVLLASQIAGVILLTITTVSDSSMDKQIVGSVISGVIRTRELTGPVGFRILIIAASISLLCLSYLVSERLFGSRDLEGAVA